MSDINIKRDGLNIMAPDGRQEVIITQLFDAPRKLVFKAYNDPDLRADWWGPRYLKTKVEKMDVKSGGAWRIIQSDAGGNEYAFHGMYHSVIEPESIVFTFEFEGEPGHVSMESLKFEDLAGGKTKVTDTAVFQSIDDRNGMYKAGIEKGTIESYDRFTELLKKLSRQQTAIAA
jgi:uncharacterized protein YndB with AHSA1/START domain